MASHERVRELVYGAVRSPDEPGIRGATARELVELEARLGRALPAELVEFLGICRGAVIGPGGVFGHRPDKSYVDLPAVRTLYPEWQAGDWLPIAGDGCGNYYMLLADGAVGFVDTMADPGVIEEVAAPDLFTFIEGLLANDQAPEDPATHPG
ncbi:SMI1/KNR4 family protein [Kribbella sp. NBC_01245]|uniref:SMI1/KNR4 family protein n=1 Tax=Kribbella sp. NBC_01245 TaxID=2903578 RepID=UPI002E285724|nr:SMI1/KNR4 family protein [Kribbella sp. NBC_01245]